MNSSESCSQIDLMGSLSDTHHMLWIIYGLGARCNRLGHLFESPVQSVSVQLVIDLAQSGENT